MDAQQLQRTGLRTNLTVDRQRGGLTDGSSGVGSRTRVLPGVPGSDAVYVEQTREPLDLNHANFGGQINVDESPVEGPGDVHRQIALGDGARRGHGISLVRLLDIEEDGLQLRSNLGLRPREPNEC